MVEIKSIMPETQTQPLEVPKRGDPDRKRVLNVLAQRRYREYPQLTGRQNRTRECITNCWNRPT